MKVLRSRIYEKMEQEKLGDISSTRKSMVGSGDRSERIRTFNFPQGRVTEHRIGLTLHKLDAILEGHLDEIIDALIDDVQFKQLQSGGMGRELSYGACRREVEAKMRRSGRENADRESIWLLEAFAGGGFWQICEDEVPFSVLIKIEAALNRLSGGSPFNMSWAARIFSACPSSPTGGG